MCQNVFHNTAIHCTTDGAIKNENDGNVLRAQHPDENFYGTNEYEILICRRSTHNVVRVIML